MEKSELIKKWLDDSLSPEEFEAFKALEDYDDLIKMSWALKQFKAPEINTDKKLQSILSQKKKINNKLRYFKVLSRVAAMLILCFGVYFFFMNKNTTTIVSTEIAQKTSVNLPDNSIVNLNTMSTVNFNEKSWSEKRIVKLSGEAYFKVAKGAKFDVITDEGIVSVLGTEFNVKHRDSNFEVVCYEGSVQVDYKGDITVLTPGDIFKKGMLFKLGTIALMPAWVNNESDFKSEPFINVIEEFERQYDVKIVTENINTEKLFTGKFSHNDIEIAIKAIALPFNLNYRKTGDKVILKRE